MDIKQIKRYYSTLSQGDIDTIAEVVRRNGFMPVIAAVADILTQSPQRNASEQPALSFSLGGALASAQKVDRECPPVG